MAKNPERHGKPLQRPVWASDNALTRKEERFIQEYMTCWSATKAAKNVGYSSASASQLGSRLLRKLHIQNALDAAMAIDGAGLRLRIAEGLANIAFDDTTETSPNKLSALDKLAKVTGMYKTEGGNQVQVNIVLPDDIKNLC